MYIDEKIDKHKRVTLKLTFYLNNLMTCSVSLKKITFIEIMNSTYSKTIFPTTFASPKVLFQLGGFMFQLKYQMDFYLRT